MFDRKNNPLCPSLSWWCEAQEASEAASLAPEASCQGRAGPALAAGAVPGPVPPAALQTTLRQDCGLREKAEQGCFPGDQSYSQREGGAEKVDSLLSFRAFYCTSFKVLDSTEGEAGEQFAISLLPLGNRNIASPRQLKVVSWAPKM